jgi:hypothetical protein
LDLVQLPRLDAGGAHALATSVVSTARKQKTLPPAVTEAVGEVSTTLADLGDALAGALPSGEDSAAAREADTRIDAAWGAIFYWASGWARAPGIAEASVAAKLRDSLFPDGLRFTQAAFAQEWSESKSRLTYIKEHKLEASFEKLGGTKLLKTVRSAHEAYGEALGITDAVEVEEKGIAVRDALDAVAEALRNYVLQVSATVRKKDAKSRALAQKLLAPIAEYRGGSAAKKAPADDGTDPTDASAEAPPPDAAAAAAKKPAPVG